MNVLIVDDEFLVRLGLRSAISWEAHGFTLAGDARSAEEALALIPILEPVVVITDIIMSKMSGLDLIEAVKQQNLRASCIILTSHRDFSFAKKAVELGAVDYILKHEITASSVITALNKAVEQLKLRHEGIVEQKESTTEQHYSEYCRVLSLQVDHYYQVLGQRNECEPSRMQSSLIGVVSHIISFYCQAMLLSIEKQAFLFLLCIPTKDEDEKHDWNLLLQRLQKKLVAVMNLSVHLGLSALYPMSEKNDTVKKLMQEMDSRFSLDQSIYKEDDPQNSKEVAALTTEVVKPSVSFKKYWIEGAYEQAVSTFAKQCKEAALSRSAVLGQSMQVLHFISSQSTESSELSRIRLGETTPSYRDILETSTDVASVAQVLQELTMNALQAKNQGSSQQSGIPEAVEKAVEYIHTHYRQTITLDSLASFANKSPNYFSTLFTSSMKISPISYINKVRVDKSSELLLHTSLSMKEIASLSGFENEKYFYRMFKKIKGVSPGVYKSENCAPESSNT